MEQSSLRPVYLNGKRSIDTVRWESPSSSLCKIKIDDDVFFAFIEHARWRHPVTSSIVI